MPRFAILRHQPETTSDRPLHWDFMLEAGDSLLTWALDREPVYDLPIEAEQLADHRHAYLDYEGPVSGGRGTVSRWDRGEFTWRNQSDRELVISIRGALMQGQVRLTHDASAGQRWVVSFSAEMLVEGR